MKDQPWITVVSLSPALDKRMEVAGFRPGGTHRVLSTRADAAGKAIHVALGLSALGRRVRCMGILPGRGGAFTERLSRGGVLFDFLDAPGEVRVNQKIYDRLTGEITEINEPCPDAPEALLEAAADAALAAARDSAFLVLTGSLPGACPADWYARLIARVREAAPHCRCVLDADGERLRLGIPAKPFLIKPNEHELAEWAGRPLASRGEVLQAARTLRAQGVSWVVVSMGAQGAMLVTEEGAFAAEALKERIQTTTGAGDAMVAGLLHGIMDGMSAADVLRYGVAAATAHCMEAGDGFLQKECAQRLRAKIQIEPMGL
ncbi:MAG: 1-phosphofructokinase family hexose kinase [Oscillospiraceae bacterium]|jgi:1-phosphofructokinase|nr:1-phosphofructokinase family hexose kinase [Oscillospiraceae bacterium]